MLLENGVWIGISAGMTNRLVHEALKKGIIDAFGRIEAVQCAAGDQGVGQEPS